VLNASKGPAVWALRAQTDKLEYAACMRKVLEETPNLVIREGAAGQLGGGWRAVGGRLLGSGRGIIRQGRRRSGQAGSMGAPGCIDQHALNATAGKQEHSPVHYIAG
jgi:hypothetical protein